MPFSKLLRLQDDKWNNPEDSIGAFIGYLRGGRYRCWEAAGPARLAFRELSPDIKDCLETSAVPPTDIVSWSIYMIGHSEKNAAPKILICSADSKTRKDIRKLIKESKIMDKYPGIGLGDVSALPDRHVIRQLSREAIEAILPFGCAIDGEVLADTSEPALGKRIFVVNPHDFSLRPATVGPIILQDGRCYQLTVAHAFRHTTELDHLPGKQIAEDDCDFDGMSDAEIDDESQYDEMIRKGSATPGEIDSDKASFMASFDAFSGEKHSSSTSESPPSDYLDTGSDPWPSAESTEDNRDFSKFDVTQLQYFGKLIFSSLTGSNPTLDYALLETSRVVGNSEKSYLITGSLLSSIGEIGSEDINILARTSPYCPVEGRLTATPSYIRLPEQHTFQQVYPIRLDMPLHDGDCGTAVFGKGDHRFYGHIVAGGPGTSIAYLIPAEEISRDVQARLGFGLVWMPQQNEQHSKADLQLGTGLSLDSPNSGEPSIRNPTTCKLEEPQRDQFLGTSIGVQQWLQQKRDPQPSQDLFINSQSFVVQKRRTKDTIDYVNDVLGAKSKPPSVQTTDSSASSASKKLPKRQNSCSTDDETTSEYPLAKRHRSELKSHALHHMSPVSYGSVSSTQPAAILPPEASIDATQGIQRQVCDILSSSSSFSSSHIETGASTTQRDEEAGGITRRLVSPQDFEDACETCVFWLFSPEQFSSSDRRACYGRKEEISRIITHIADHHGLIRGRDPRNASRKYLVSCQIHDPLVKGTGACVKCSSLHKWNDRDSMDLTHNGVVVCLRCWRKFSKKEMKVHMDGPLCDYNTECSKARKVWILYTAFCSETQLPSKPPQNRTPRKSSHRLSPRPIHQGQQQDGQDSDYYSGDGT
ncbi:hypothetical protein FAVG1_05083 [Fusarium avenaceum]|nr:hypothetical protein FAVG1_05083 [Fusarium avenaceum]